MIDSEMTREEALSKVREWLSAKNALQDPLDDFPTWAENRFYVPDRLDAISYEPLDERGLITLTPHQRTITRFMLDWNRPLDQTLQTLVYSTPKKEGKTTVAAAVARYVAERWGDYSDVIMVGNDVDQARSRIYDASIRSMELDPLYNRQRRELMLPDGTTEWRLVRSVGDHIPNWGKIRPIALDYRGEAGANPTASIWTEVWGADQEKARRLFDELTPPPTRLRSIRWLEGYAGYEGESILWREIWDRAQKEGRRVTREELDPYGGWPYEDDPPLWINPAARLCAYIDQGVEARRMPWKRGERGRLYYASQEATERPDAFRRLHMNEWVSSVQEFIPQAWWQACRETEPEAIASRLSARLLGKNWPIVIGCDAAVTGDCAAIVGVCRDPVDPSAVVVLFVRLWTPTPGHPLDYGAPDGLDAEIRRMCQQFNVAEVAYDPYQLHKLMTDLGRDGVVWCRPFNQTAERAKADKQLYDLIRNRRIKHPGIPDLDQHIKNAAAKHAPDEDTRLRIIKKTQSGKIDAAVALSMAAAECLRLNLV